MPPSREWRFRVDDIVTSIDTIFTYIAGMDYDDFVADSKTRDAVVLNLAVMGEAARHVPGEIRNRHPAIEWEEMITNRNVMIHVYFGLKPQILWDTIHKDLPSVRSQLVTLLAKEV